MQPIRDLVFLCLLAGTATLSLAQSPSDTVKIPPEAHSAAAAKVTPVFAPMTPSDRLHDYLKNAFSPASLAESGVSAGLDQWSNHPVEWGQGSRGYARRFGNAYARTLLRETMMFGISSALHEDNRYRRSTGTGIVPRLKYALMSTVIARRDDGSRRLSVSRLGGTVGAAFVSRIWQPADTNGTGEAWAGFALSMGSQAAFHVVSEFFPGKNRK